MKKLVGLTLGVLLALVAAFSPAFAGNGRQIGTPANPDAVSWYGGGCDQAAGGNGISGCEVAIDYYGNLLPTTANTQTLGTSALPWLNVYALNGNTAGNETSGTVGTSTLLTPGVAPTNHSILGGFSLVSTTLGVSGQNFGVNKSTIIPVNSSYELLISSGGPIVMTSLPNISTTTVVGGSTLIPDGFILVLTSSVTAASGGITLQSNGGLAGSQLFLGAATRVIALHDVLTLKFHSVAVGAASYWEELAYGSDNN